MDVGVVWASERSQLLRTTMATLAIALFDKGEMGCHRSDVQRPATMSRSHPRQSWQPSRCCARSWSTFTFWTCRYQAPSRPSQYADWPPKGSIEGNV